MNKFENLDKALSSEAQQTVRAMVRALPEEIPSMEWRSKLNERLLQSSPREWVKSLPEEMPSLAWRSELNEKLLAISPVKKRSPLRLFAIASGVGAVAACVLTFLTVPQDYQESPAAAFNGFPTRNEEALIAEHVHSISALDLGAGTIVADNSSEKKKDTYQWSEVDVESL